MLNYFNNLKKRISDNFNKLYYDGFLTAIKNFIGGLILCQVVFVGVVSYLAGLINFFIDVDYYVTLFELVNYTLIVSSFLYVAVICMAVFDTWRIDYMALMLFGYRIEFTKALRLSESKEYIKCELAKQGIGYYRLYSAPNNNAYNDNIALYVLTYDQYITAQVLFSPDIIKSEYFA